MPLRARSLACLGLAVAAVMLLGPLAGPRSSLAFLQQAPSFPAPQSSAGFSGAAAGRWAAAVPGEASASSSPVTLQGVGYCGVALLLLASATSRSSLCRGSKKVSKSKGHSTTVVFAAPTSTPPPSRCSSSSCYSQEALIDLLSEDVLAPAAAPAPLPSPMLGGFVAAPTLRASVAKAAAEPKVAEEAAPGSSAAPRSPRAARFAGGARCAAPRTASRSASASTERATRRRAGAKLIERPTVYEPTARPFDSSRLRVEIQNGLRALSCVSTNRARASKTPAAAKECRLSSGVLYIEAKYSHRLQKEP